MLPLIDALPQPWQALAYMLCLVLGLVLLERGADWFIDAAAALAIRLHAPQIVVGLLTAGGEWEELVVVLVAVFGGHSGIALGDIIGSTIANILGSFPLGLIGRKPLRLERQTRWYGVALLLVTLLAAGLLSRGTITRPIGGALICVFIFYVMAILLLIRRGRVPAQPDDDDDEAEEREEMQRRPALALAGFVALGLALVSLGAWLVVEPSVYAAHALGFSETVIGLTIVAIGTTLPDKAISLLGGIKQQSGLVAANAVGSNIFLLTLVLGLAAFAGPLAASGKTLWFDVPVMLGCAALLCLLLWRAQLHWRVGLALLLLYIGYLAAQFLLG